MPIMWMDEETEASRGEVMGSGLRREEVERLCLPLPLGPNLLSLQLSVPGPLLRAPGS